MPEKLPMPEAGRLYRCCLSLLLLTLLTGLAGCSLNPKSDPSDPAIKFSSAFEQPMKSDNDRRDYRYTELANGLKVLLISDPETEKAAAALDVAVGAGDDPADRPGLAHFLEHMLFLGTEKYPEAGAYQAFISAHGGSNNAYTSFEHTNYYFDIEPEFFAAALDRFAQFFISPSLDPEYVEREKNAVHSEYTSKLLDEGRRSLDVLKANVDQEHPFASFTVGNLDTLADDERGKVVDALRSFYLRHYNASNMALVILGGESLDQLEVMAQAMFAAVPAGERSASNKPASVYASGSLPMQLKVKAHRELRRLTLDFPIPDVNPHYRFKPTAFIGNVLGHEGEGSLLSYLKDRGWADSLGAGTGLSFRGGANFSINIGLTEAGMDAVDEIVAAVFAAVNLLQDEGLKPYLYAEQKAVAETQFRYQEAGQAIRKVSGLASALQRVPARDLLRNYYIFEAFDPELIRRFLEPLRPDNMLLTLTSNQFDGELRSPWYDVPYSRSTIGAERVEAWKQPPAIETLAIPAPNEFVSDDIALLDLEEGAGKTPVPLLDDDKLRIWFAQDDRYRVPKGQLTVYFHNEAMGDTARNSVLGKLYARLLREQLNEFVYPAGLAGLYFSLYSGNRSLTLRVSGFTGQQQILLQRILDAMADFKLDRGDFERVHAEYERGWRNSAKKKPYRKLLDQVRTDLLRPAWSEPELLAALDAVDFDSVREFGSSLHQRVHAEGLLFGNYDRERARRLLQPLQKFVASRDAGERVPVGVGHIAAASDAEAVTLRQTVLDQDSALVLYAQGDDNSLGERAVMALHSQILKSPFYQQLRTEQQLGYIVAASPMPLYKMPGLAFFVQSPSTPVGDIREAMLDFLEQGNLPQSLTEEQFLTHRQALVQRLLEQPKNLSEQAHRYLQDIHYREFDFDRRERLAAAVEAIGFDAWKQAYERHFLQPQARRWLWAEAWGAQRKDYSESLQSNSPISQWLSF